MTQPNAPSVPPAPRPSYADRLPHYAAYLEELHKLPTFNSGYGNCEYVSKALTVNFPELEARKGVFLSVAWGPRPHWWTRHRDTGEIVDPTAKQHPDGVWFPKSAERYTDLTDMTQREAQEAGHVPVGKCIECGESCYLPDCYSGSFCTEACAKSFEAAMQEGQL